MSQGQPAGAIPSPAGWRLLVPTLADTLIQAELERSPRGDPEPAEGRLVCSTHISNGVPERSDAEKTWIVSSEAMQSSKWLREKSRILSCRKPDIAGLLWGWKPGIKEFLTPVRCHSRWHDGCRDMRVKELILALKPKGLLTLTWRQAPNDLARDLCWRDLWCSWKKFHGWLERHGLNPGRYIAVTEPQANGMPHLHIATEHFPVTTRIGSGWMQRKNKSGQLIWVEIIDSFSPPDDYRCRCKRNRKPIKGLTHRVKDGWIALGGGMIVTWERIYQNPTYIAKYLEKGSVLPEPIRAMLTVNDRDLWSRSHGIELPEEVPSGYQLVRGDRKQLRATVRARANRLRLP